MSAPSLYAVLGLTSAATSAGIKAAYRALAKECHPDTHPGDPVAADLFREITHAYEVLSDHETLAYYDQHGVAPNGPSPEDVNGELYQFVARAFDVALKSAISEGRDPEKVDLIARAVDKICQDIDLLAVHTKQVASEIGNLTKIRDRIVKKTGDDNIVAKMFDSGITNMQSQIEHDKHQKDLCDRAIAFFQDYEYRFDHEIDARQTTQRRVLGSGRERGFGGMGV